MESVSFPNVAGLSNANVGWDNKQLRPAHEGEIQVPADQPPAPFPAQKHTQSYPITMILVGLNCGNFIAMVIANKIWPQVGLLQWGADWGPLSLRYQWWRLLASTFIHLSVLHLLGNVVVLWVLGKHMERVLGKWGFLLFYLSCGLAGSIASVALHPEDLVCGASGGVFGLAGGVIGIFILSRQPFLLRQIWKPILLTIWIAGNIYEGMDNPAQIAGVAHVAGLVAGLVLVGVLTIGKKATAERMRWVFTWVVAILFLSAISARYYNNYVVLLGAAVKHLDQGRIDDALREVTDVLQKKPNSPAANVLAAEVYLKKADYSNAETAARHVLEVDNKNDHATYLLGMIEMHTGRCFEGRDLAQQLIARNKNNAEGRSLNMAECDLDGIGDRLLVEGKLDLAIAEYRIALRENPHDYRAQLGLAKAYQSNGMQKEADAAAAKAKAMRPDAQH